MNPGSSEIRGAVGARCDLCDLSRSQFSLLIVSLFKKKQKTDQTSDKKIKPAARRCDRTAVAAPHAVHLAPRSLARHSHDHEADVSIPIIAQRRAVIMSESHSA